MAILNSSYKDKIMYLDTWQIIRVKVSFITTSRDFRFETEKNEQNSSLIKVFRVTEARVSELPLYFIVIFRQIILLGTLHHYSGFRGCHLTLRSVAIVVHSTTHSLTV